MWTIGWRRNISINHLQYLWKSMVDKDPKSCLLQFMHGYLSFVSLYSICLWSSPKVFFFFSSSFRFHNWYILQWASLTYNACVKFWKKFRKKHKSFLRYSVRLTVNLAWWVLSKPILKFISSTKCFITLPVGMRSKLDFAGAMNVHFILMHPGYIYWVW